MSSQKVNCQVAYNSVKYRFPEVLASLENHQFAVKKTIDVDPSMQLKLFDIDYYGLELNVLETFE